MPTTLLLQAVAATVTSITYTDLLVLPAGDFHRLLEQFPQLHETILVCTGLQDGLAEGRRQKSSRGRRRASPAGTGTSASCHRQHSPSFMNRYSSSSFLKRRGSSDLSGVQSLSSEHDEPRGPLMRVPASRSTWARSFGGGGVSPSRERSGFNPSLLRDGEEEAKV